jgi:hypothetical protein
MSEKPASHAFFFFFFPLCYFFLPRRDVKRYMEKKPNAEDAYADMSQPPPLLSREEKEETEDSRKDVDFLLLYGLSGLCEYVVERKAEKALPLILALSRHLRLALKRGKTSVAITQAVWRTAGNPPRNVRTTVLAHISEMPDLIVLREKRTFASLAIALKKALFGCGSKRTAVRARLVSGKRKRRNDERHRLS